jgi:signal transduction histidine kinase
MLNETDFYPRTVLVIKNDVDRLKVLSDRFGKIGSTPQLEEKDLIGQIRTMMEYIRKRAAGKVHFSLVTQGYTEEIAAAPGGRGANTGPGTTTGPSANIGPGAAAGDAATRPAGKVPEPRPIVARISGPLFDWVIENLLKNALDAMEGKGSITVAIAEQEKEFLIDVTDSGKGIAAKNVAKVFKPGFTTKKRGWGLGLSLSKRIIEQYHKGLLFVRHSEPGKGTTFRIVLKK